VKFKFYIGFVSIFLRFRQMRIGIKSSFWKKIQGFVIMRKQLPIEKIITTHLLKSLIFIYVVKGLAYLTWKLSFICWLSSHEIFHQCKAKQTSCFCVVSNSRKHYKTKLLSKVFRRKYISLLMSFWRKLSKMSSATTNITSVLGSMPDDIEKGGRNKNAKLYLRTVIISKQ